MATYNPSDDALRKLVAGSRAVPDISSDDIEAALADATTKNTLSDDQVARVLGKVHRLITAASENNTPGERPVSTSRSVLPSAAPVEAIQEPKLVIIPASLASQRRVSRTAIAAFSAALLSLICVCLLTPPELSRRSSERDNRQQVLANVYRNQAGRYQLTAKPAPDVVEPAKVAVGDTIETHDFERRRLALPDESILYVNANSSVIVRSSRSIDVTHGSIFVEVAQKPDAAKFEVITPNRKVTSLGTKFAVNVDDAETAVTVTQGRVLVSGINAPITAGQKLVATAPSGDRPVSTGRSTSSTSEVENLSRTGGLTPAARQDHMEYVLTSLPSAASELEWTRDLIAAATGPLVPKSEYSGGALVTIDPNGQSSQLSLRNYHVDVHIEDGFARTTIDQTYFNHTHSRLEGTFHFPLPPDASLSRLAMYVNGKLMEGGMAERDHARNTFEEIKRKMLDPALLEWVDGSTFKMRVFPLEPRQEKRIILSYSQRLPSVDGQMTYRFPAGHTMDVVREWSAAVRIKGGDGSTWHSPTHDLKAVDSTARGDAADLLLEASEKNARLDRDLVVQVADSKNLKSQISNIKSESQQYLMLRLRPDLMGDMQRKPHHWVFLFEHSGDRSPLLARTQIEILRTLLNNAEHTDTFSIVKASTRATLYAEQPLPCSPENIAAAVKHLENVHLVGAMDLAGALKVATQASGRASALRADAPTPADPRLEEHVADRLIEDPASGPDEPTQPLPVASATGEILQNTTSPEGATHLLFDEICRAFSPLHFITIAPGPYGPGKGFVGPSGPESQSPLTLALSPESGERGQERQTNPGSPLSAFRFPVFVHLGSGHTALGERDAARLVESLPKDVPYIGIGIGKRWNQSLMKFAASRTGGLSVQINPDEDVAWRAFELFSKLHSPRLVNVKVEAAQPPVNNVMRSGPNGPIQPLPVAPATGEIQQNTTSPEGATHLLFDEMCRAFSPLHFMTIAPGPHRPGKGFVGPSGPESPVAIAATGIVLGGLTPSRSPGHSQADPHFLLFSDTISQGEEIAAICRVAEGQALPKEITVTATLNGQPWSQTVAIENMNEQASYLPRHWAKLEIDRLLAENAPENREAIVALSKSMYVMSPFTSLLVLENDDMYTQFNVDRGRKDHWAMYACPEQIPVIVENGDAVVLTGSSSDGDSATSEAPKQDVFSTIVRIPRLSWPMPSPTQNHVNEWGWHPMNGPGSAPMGTAANNLWFRLNESDDFISEPNAVMRYARDQTSWEYLQNLNRWGSDGADVWRLDVDNDGDGIRTGKWIEPRFDGGDITVRATLAPLTDFTATLRQDFLYRMPRFDSPRETFTSPAPGFFRAPVGYFDVDPLYQYTIPLGMPTSMKVYGTDVNRNEGLTYVAPQPISGLDLGVVQFEEPLENILDYESEFEIEGRFSTQAGERSRLNELLADNRGNSRLGYINNDLNSVEWSAMLQRKSAWNPREWNELKRRRERLQFRERQPVNDLSIKISLHVHDAEFQNAIQQLASSSGVKIVIDVPALRRVGISEKQLVNVDVDDITLKSVLNLLLDQIGDLTCLVKGDVVTIRPTLRREQDGSAGLPLFANTQTHRWSAAQPGNGASLVSLPVFNGSGPQSLAMSPGIFVDLMSHAPGLNTSAADALAVMEEGKLSNFKSQISNPPTGRVDEAARGLIEKARGRGWEAITIGGSNHEPGVTILYDGQGRHVWERTVSEGLREQVVCDGTTLWHVYRDLSLASKRSFSQFHHEDFSRLVPWLLPSADELARGADVVAVDERTVAIVPLESGKRKAESVDGSTESETSDLRSQISPRQMHLIFDADGRLVERQWIERSQSNGVETNTTVLRITYAVDGVVKVLDRDGKEEMSLNLHRAIAAEPKLVPDLNGLVVLPMPVRTPETILARMQADKASLQNADLGQVGLHVTRSVSDRDSHGINQEKAAGDQPASTDAAAADSAVQADKTTTQNADLGQVGLHVARSVSDRDFHGVNQEKATEDQAASIDAAPADSAVLADKTTMQKADLGQVGLQDADLSEDDALSLMLAYMANGNAARMVEIARTRFIEKGDTRDGLYVLLSRYPSALVRAAETAPANGTALPGFDLRPSVEGSPLRQYLRQCINWMDEPNPFVNAKDFRIDAPESSFLQRMATARNWYVRWSSGNAIKDLTQAQVQIDVEQTLAFVATCQSDQISWMILSAMKPLLSTPEQQTMFAKAMERFESHPQIGRFARQERITALFAAGQHEEARQLFAEWFRDHLDSGMMPVIGEELHKAYLAGPNGHEMFTELTTSEAKRLLESHQLMTVNLLAIQISQLGDLPLADRLMTMLIEQLNVEQRPDVSLLVIEHLRRLNDPRAAKLLDHMLELPSVSDLPQIWRFASTIAEASGHKRLAVDRLELAMQLEFATRPTTINIETVRADYIRLLAKYEELINAAATLETVPPEGLAERIIQAADQWRSLDDDDTAACQMAARLLAKLHQKDTAWDYQITPLAENSGESTPWINLARQLTTDKSFTLADMAWSRAFEFETSNPEILLEHAKMQMESKSKDAARALLQRVERGSWQPRFQSSVDQAKQLLQSL